MESSFSSLLMIISSFLLYTSLVSSRAAVISSLKSSSLTDNTAFFCFFESGELVLSSTELPDDLFLRFRTNCTRVLAICYVIFWKISRRVNGTSDHSAITRPSSPTSLLIGRNHELKALL